MASIFVKFRFSFTPIITRNAYRRAFHRSFTAPLITALITGRALPLVENYYCLSPWKGRPESKEIPLEGKDLLSP